MKKLILLFLFFYAVVANAQIGRVGINTSTPLAILHVKDSSVLFSGVGFNIPSTPGDPPVSGGGIRMMWYPAKAAFRVGAASTNEWDKINIGDYSFASGLGTVASGISTTAIGRATSATGYNATAIGSSSTAAGDYSIAIGLVANASGRYSLALGGSTIASGESSTTMGYSSLASGTYSTALGLGTEASGGISTAIGNHTIASGSTSTAMGSLTTASGTTSLATGSLTTALGITSTAMGNKTVASGQSSFAIGHNVTARAFGSLALGQFNDSIASSSKTVWTDSDPVFIIGNGTSDVDRKNAITILKNGRTGINTSTPLAGLHIVAVDNTFDQSIRLESALGPSSFCNILYDGSLKFRTSDPTANYQWRDNTSNTIMQLTSAGNLSIDGVLTQSSDIRLKKNIAPLENSLSKIMRLSGYQYNWIDASRGNALQSGVLAQEVEKQMPELVMTDGEGDKAVNYNGLIPYLIESVKELNKKIEELKKENELLRAKKQ